MGENRFVIVDVTKKVTLYGKDNHSLRFSTREIAYEVGYQFFKEPEHFMVVEIF